MVLDYCSFFFKDECSRGCYDFFRVLSIWIPLCGVNKLALRNVQSLGVKTFLECPLSDEGAEVKTLLYPALSENMTRQKKTASDASHFNGADVELW